MVIGVKEAGVASSCNIENMRVCYEICHLLGFSLQGNIFIVFLIVYHRKLEFLHQPYNKSMLIIIS